MKIFPYLNKLLINEGDVVQFSRPPEEPPEKLITRDEYDRVSDRIDTEWYKKKGQFLHPIQLHRYVKGFFDQAGYTGYDPETMDVLAMRRKDTQTMDDLMKPMISYEAFNNMVDEISTRHPEKSEREVVDMAFQVFHELGYQYAFISDEDQKEVDDLFDEPVDSADNVVRLFPGKR